jgi:hypothetical protein
VNRIPLLLRRRFHAAGAALLLVSAACGGRTEADATVDPATLTLGGTGGSSFAPVEVVVFEDESATALGEPLSITRIVASTRAGICARITEQGLKVLAGERLLFARFDALEARSFTVDGASDANPAASLFDAAVRCAPEGPYTDAVDMGRGTIAITKVGASVEGVVDLEFAADQVRGRFTAVACPGANKSYGRFNCR